MIFVIRATKEQRKLKYRWPPRLNVSNIFFRLFSTCSSIYLRCNLRGCQRSKRIFCIRIDTYINILSAIQVTIIFFSIQFISCQSFESWLLFSWEKPNIDNINIKQTKKNHHIVSILAYLQDSYCHKNHKLSILFIVNIIWIIIWSSHFQKCVSFHFLLLLNYSLEIMLRLYLSEFLILC